jgi:hypothetical protein
LTSSASDGNTRHEIIYAEKNIDGLGPGTVQLCVRKYECQMYRCEARTAEKYAPGNVLDEGETWYGTKLDAATAENGKRPAHRGRVIAYHIVSYLIKSYTIIYSYITYWQSISLGRLQTCHVKKIFSQC